MIYKATPTFKDSVQHYHLESEQELENGIKLTMDIPNAIATKDGIEVLASDKIPFVPRNRAERRKFKRARSASR